MTASIEIYNSRSYGVVQENHCGVDLIVPLFIGTKDDKLCEDRIWYKLALLQLVIRNIEKGVLLSINTWDDEEQSDEAILFVKQKSKRPIKEDKLSS
ncbi:10648_t:CDS:2 [Funneliformis caledonium]|uniref:10648_t:CDS:1 n=1 Tax=Funneliformis caledonium TaxID=1117310 RepID=A0A9N9BUA8_9GLOM|nr:10648_t:CDS:2 [Funneliformis caledonium]